MKNTPLYTVVRALLPWLFRILMPIRVKHADYVPKDGRVVLCCNHASMTDPLRLAYSVNRRRQVFFMAKEELFHNAFVAAVIRGLGAFPVIRGKGDQSAIDTAQEILSGEGVLGIFIEGTRARDGQMLRPKSGAVRIASSCNAPIVPCCITPADGGLPKLFRPCLVTFGKPIPPEELHIEEGTPTEFRDATHLVMSKIVELRESDLKLLDRGISA